MSMKMERARAQGGAASSAIKKPAFLMKKPGLTLGKAAFDDEG